MLFFFGFFLLKSTTLSVVKDLYYFEAVYVQKNIEIIHKEWMFQLKAHLNCGNIIFLQNSQAVSSPLQSFTSCKSL